MVRIDDTELSLKVGCAMHLFLRFGRQWGSVSVRGCRQRKSATPITVALFTSPRSSRRVSNFTLYSDSSMGNSQSYDVTNVHHGKDKRQEPTTTGTVKPLSDGMPPTLDADEREKQENTSPKDDTSAVTTHTEPPQATVQVVTVQDEPVVQATPKQMEEAKQDEPEEKVEAVKVIVQEMSNIELETLERVASMEQTPLDAVPSQSSYDKLN